MADTAAPGHGTLAAVVVDIYPGRGHGAIDTLLKANGWHRVSAWMDSNDVPAAVVRQCMVKAVRD